MPNFGYVFLAVGLVLSTGCNSAKAPEEPAQIKPVETSAPRLYGSHEVGGDLAVLGSGNCNGLATVPLGKRPRGIHPSPDHKTIYVALSGSPIAGPDVDESTLPPPDKTADGIGVFDVAQNKVVRTIHEI